MVYSCSLNSWFCLGMAERTKYRIALCCCSLMDRAAVFKSAQPPCCILYLDRVGRHVAHEVSAVGVIQHGHRGEGIPQQAVQLVDVLSR